MTALYGSAEEARLHGFIPIIMSSSLCEDILDISALYVDLVLKTIGYPLPYHQSATLNRT